jgi:hypothetical protein
MLNTFYTRYYKSFQKFVCMKHYGPIFLFLFATIYVLRALLSKEETITVFLQFVQRQTWFDIHQCYRYTIHLRAVP